MKLIRSVHSQGQDAGEKGCSNDGNSEKLHGGQCEPKKARKGEARLVGFVAEFFKFNFSHLRSTGQVESSYWKHPGARLLKNRS